MRNLAISIGILRITMEHIMIYDLSKSAVSYDSEYYARSL